jgi:hypothetical protein
MRLNTSTRLIAGTLLAGEGAVRQFTFTLSDLTEFNTKAGHPATLRPPNS